MIFAKDDNHATEIVDIAKNVFKPEFENDAIPEKFVQKITYSVGDSNALIRDLRTEKDFRIAVTVTLVATGTWSYVKKKYKLNATNFLFLCNC